jgi:two-component system sensor histidine kinase RpfC
MILVIDDHLDTCRVLERMLRISGVPAECVTSPWTALQRLNDGQPPDAVVLDYHMPELSGLDLLRIIRRMDGLEGLPVVMYSADPSPDAAAESRKLGARAYFVKGITPINQLIEDVKRLAKGSAAN